MNISDIKDRVPTKPNRKKITPEGGQPYYATVEFADEPTENGTPINKALFDGLKAAQSQAEAGESNEVLMTPLRTKQAIEANTPYIIGTYAGDATQNRQISLGFKPSMVQVFCINPESNGEHWHYYVSTIAVNFRFGLTINDDGFIVTQPNTSASYYYPNATGRTYAYIAFE